MSIVKDFNEYRQRMNDVILAQDNRVIKRFFSLDNQTYEDGALPVVTKELLGLVASMVLRCDDCIRYHLGQCYELGVSKEQIYEACSVALIVGGSIFIPHMRRAAEYWEELEKG
jgi:AhpD family alkylhydroperoxidase